MPASLVLSRNDLEAVTLTALAERAGVTVVDLGLPWGAAPDPADPRLAPETLGDPVILAELPAPALEQRLAVAGKQVHILDHHLTIAPDGTVLDRRQPLSSLEQAADLLRTGPLTRQERLVAANDRGFWPSLLAALAAEAGLAAGAPLPAGLLAEARAIRLADLAVQLGSPAAADRALAEAMAWLEGAAARGDLARFGCGRGLPDDPDMTLIRAPLPLARTLMDALTLTRLAVGAPWHQPVEALTLQMPADGPGPVGLFYSGLAARAPLLAELIAATRRGGGPAARLVLWSGGGDGSAYFGARCRQNEDAEARQSVSALADRLLDNLLTGNRPVLGWRSRFLAVLDYGSSGKRPIMTAAAPDRLAPAPAGDQERLYLLPHLRPLFTPAVGADGIPPVAAGQALDPMALPIASYSLTGPALALTVDFCPWETSRAVLGAAIDDVTLHFCTNGLVLLDWSVGGGVRLATDDGPLWRQMLGLGAGPAAGAVATMAQVLDFTEAARLCYSPFAGGFARKDVVLTADGREAGRLAYARMVDPAEGALSGWFAALAAEALAPFGLAPDDLQLVHDERARVVAALVGWGQGPDLPTAQADARVLLARLALVDPYGTGPAYDPAFAEAELAAGEYRRFAAYGSVYAASDHAFVLLAHGAFAAGVLMGHMSTLYRRLFLVALFYSGVLHRFALGLAVAARRRLRHQAACDRGDGAAAMALDEVKARVDQLRAGFVCFANGLWFDDLSGQIQGRELFALIRRRLGVAAQYQTVAAELDRTAQLEAADASARSQRVTGDLSALGALVAGAVGALQVIDAVVPAAGWLQLLAVPAGLLVALLTLAMVERLSVYGAVRRLWSILRRFLRIDG